MKDWKTKQSKSIRGIFAPHGSSNHTQENREKYDYYATNPNCVEDLFNRENFSGNIWECACGEGHLSKRMFDLGSFYGINVYSSDIIERGYGDVIDFLNIDVQEWNGDIITNPPYKYAQEFVEKSLKIIPNGNKVAMFLKLTFLEGQKRKSLFKNNPPKTVYIYSKRQECAKNGKFTGSSAVAYCWYVWKKGYKGDTIIKWI
tara:strand:+ start:160 stop:765 length:606 start_codon:yes stop_codon:yes gene_type:complete